MQETIKKEPTQVSKLRRGGPRSVVRVLKVLHCLSADEETSLSKLTNLTRTPKSSLLILLRALAEAGYVTQSENGYTLGPEAFALASGIVAQRRLVQIARPKMRDLSHEVGETILLAELSADKAYAVYIDRVEGNRAIRYVADIGTRRELYASSAGRVLLAFQNQEFWREYLSRTELVPLTSRKAISAPQLLEMLRNIRLTHLATSNEDVSEGVAGFGAPIFDSSQRVIAALVIAAPSGRVQQNAEDLGRRIRETASEISRLLGANPVEPVSISSKSNRA